MHEATCVQGLVVGPNQPLRHLKGVETWFKHPTILARVIPQSTECRLLLKGPVVQGFVWLINSDPGSSPNQPTNGSVVGIGICIEMSDVVSLESN